MDITVACFVGKQFQLESLTAEHLISSVSWQHDAQWQSRVHLVEVVVCNYSARI